MTTPSALSMVASQLFIDAQPPLLSQEGTTYGVAFRSLTQPDFAAFVPGTAVLEVFRTPLEGIVPILRLRLIAEESNK